MREIKFRVWDGEKMHHADNEKYHLLLSGEPIYLDGYWDETWDGEDEHRFWVDETRKITDVDIQQFTGLLDSEGKEIFEGDVCQFNYFYGHVGADLGYQECEHQLTGVVKWDHSGWGLDAIKGEHWRGYTGFKDGEGYSSFVELYSMSESSYGECSFTIIGNIHESPELLQP